MVNNTAAGAAGHRSEPAAVVDRARSKALHRAGSLAGKGSARVSAELGYSLPMMIAVPQVGGASGVRRVG